MPILSADNYECRMTISTTSGCKLQVFLKTCPNTHLKFDVLFSYKTLFGRGNWALGRYGTSWRHNDMYTFVKLTPETNLVNLEAKLPAIVEKYSPELAQNNRKDVLFFQPLRSIHLTSDLAEEPEPNGNERIVWFLSLIGLLVLSIAWINYVNLSTARAMERAKEVGVRKVSGAMKGQLVSQFLVESAVINLLSIALAFGLTVLALPWFNQLTGLQFDVFHLLRQKKINN